MAEYQFTTNFSNVTQMGISIIVVHAVLVKLYAGFVKMNAFFCRRQHYFCKGPRIFSIKI